MKETDSGRGLRLQPRSWPRCPALGLRPRLDRRRDPGRSFRVQACGATGLNVRPDQAPPRRGCSPNGRRAEDIQASVQTVLPLGITAARKGGAAGAQRRGLIMAAGANVWGSPSLTTPPSGPPTYGSLLLCPFSSAGSSHSHAPSAPPHRLRPPSPRAAPPPSCRGLLLLLLLA